MLDGFGAESRGNFVLDLWIDPQNNCEGAPQLIMPTSNEPVEIFGDTSGSTNDFTGSCGSSANSGDNVYSFTLEHPTSVKFETLKINNSIPYDTVLHLRRECDDQSTQIACNDDAGEGVLSKLEVTLDPGTYYLIVDGYSTSNRGPYRLAISLFGCLTEGFTVYGIESVSLDHTGQHAPYNERDVLRAYTSSTQDTTGWIGFDMSNIPDNLLISDMALNLRHTTWYRSPKNDPETVIVYSTANHWSRMEADITTIQRGDAVSDITSEFIVDDWNTFPIDVNSHNWTEDLDDNWLTLGVDEINENYRYMYFYGTDDASTRPSLQITGTICE